MISRAVAVLFVLLLCICPALGYTFSPGGSTISQIAMEDAINFTVTDGSTHTYTWFIDGNLVQTNSSIKNATYAYGPAILGTDQVLLKVDGTERRTWVVNNQVNMTLATASMTNLSTWNYTPPSYDIFDTIWDHNDSQDFTTNMLDVMTIPTDWWSGPNGIGAWFWVGVIISIVVLVHVKLDIIEVTCITLCLLSAITIETAETLPEPIVYLLWTFTAVGFAGVLMSLFGGEE